MGNRAVITWAEDGKWDENSTGVYLHWNGGRDSVAPLLAYCEMCSFRNPSDDDYGIARFVQVAANLLGGDGLSIGVNRVGLLDCDNGDNGVYVCDGWEITGRKYFNGKEQDDYDFAERIHDINNAQPDSLKKSSNELERLLTEYRETHSAEKDATLS